MKKSGKPGRNSASTKTKGAEVREVTTPRVNVPRASKRPAERSKQKRSRGLDHVGAAGAPQSSGSTERTRWPIAHMT